MDVFSVPNSMGCRSTIFLGACNAEGKGVNIDLQQAIFWYKKAAEQGNLIPKSLKMH
jgi:TPR repeat protein